MPTNIEKIRKDKKLTQDEVAKQLWITRQTFSKLEKGQIEPTLSQTIKLSKLFWVKIEKFIKDIWNKESQEVTMQENYLKKLVEHEKERCFKNYIKDSRDAMIVLWWIALNWMWDLLWTPKGKYTLKNVKIEDIILTWTTPETNEITINKANRSVTELKKIIKNDKKILKQIKKVAIYSTEPVLLRKTWENKYKSFDWMHRIVWHIIKWKEYIEAYVLENQSEFLPNIEPHVIYDIIKAYQRSKRTEIDKQEFIWAIKLMARNTENTKKLLKNRFNSKYIMDDDLQKLIKNVILL